MGPGSLAQGMCADELLELPDQLDLTAEQELCLEAVLESGEVQLTEAAERSVD